MNYVLLTYSFIVLISVINLKDWLLTKCCWMKKNVNNKAYFSIYIDKFLKKMSLARGL